MYAKGPRAKKSVGRVDDSIIGMREIPISRFKATCLAVLADVKEKRIPVRVTRHGVPIADVVPPALLRTKPWLGSMKDSMEVTGEIVKPIGAFRKWSAR